jgi:hypothetical protein
LVLSLRADICNNYYSGGLCASMKSDDVARPTVGIAGEGDKMRASPVLMP